MQTQTLCVNKVEVIRTAAWQRQWYPNGDVDVFHEELLETVDYDIKCKVTILNLILL